VGHTPDLVKFKCKHILLSHREAEPATHDRTPYMAWIEATILHGLIEDGKEKFEDIAYKNSACASGQHGGDLGWMHELDVVVEFSEAVKRIKIGQLGLPFYSPCGVHIVWRTG